MAIGVYKLTVFLVCYQDQWQNIQAAPRLENEANPNYQLESVKHY